MRLFASITIVLLALLSAASPAAAQSQITTGVINGTVVDQSNAVLAGVDVEIVNMDTGFDRNLVTDKDGRFSALQLPPGPYRVTFKLAGFATVVQEVVPVSVGETVRLSTSMRVSGVSETLTVTSQTPVVETTRTNSASTLNQRTVENTPILGRKFEDLL